MSTRAWIGTCFGLGLSALILGICLVWINLRLVDLSYRVKKVHDRLEQAQELNAKLEVEHINLLSSYRLRDKAAKYGLQPPQAKQVRTLK